MELFSIHCTTCKARLVVKDESLIGDILSCPKCHSMVQIVPPVGWKGSGGDSSPGDLTTDSATSSQPLAPLSDKSSGRPPSGESQTQKVAASAAAVPPVLPPRTPPTTAVKASHTAAPDSAAQSSVAAATHAEPVAAPTLFSAAVAWARRDWIVLATGLAGGVVLGAVVWLVVAVQSPAPLLLAEQAPSDGSSPDAVRNEQASPPTVEVPARENLQTAGAAGPADAPPDDTEIVAEAVLPAAEGTDQSTAGAAHDDTEPAGEQLAAAETLEDAVPQERGPALKLDPIRPMRAPRNLLGAVPSAVATPADTEPQELEPADNAQTPATESPGVAAPLSREQIDARLSVSLAGVEFSDVPLAQFAAFVADVSGVPIALDGPALAKVGRGPKSPISVKLTETTAGEALRAAVKRAGLSVALRDGRIVITGAGD